jgi:hypothetical protein
MTPVATRMLSCLERQRAHFESITRALNVLENAQEDALEGGLRQHEKSVAETRALEDEFNAILLEWESAGVPASERERIRTEAGEVALFIQNLESRLRELMSNTDSAKEQVRAQLNSLERGRGMLRKFGTPGAPVPGYIDRRA